VEFVRIYVRGHAQGNDANPSLRRQNKSPAWPLSLAGDLHFLRIRRERNSRTGAEPTDEIPVGADGTVWQESDAVTQRGALRGERGRWESEPIRQPKQQRLGRQSVLPLEALTQPLCPRSEICTPKPISPRSCLFVGDNWASIDVNPSPIEVRKLLQPLHQN
jgi:hypothetical protein